MQRTFHIVHPLQAEISLDELERRKQSIEAIGKNITVEHGSAVFTSGKPKTPFDYHRMSWRYGGRNQTRHRAECGLPKHLLKSLGKRRRKNIKLLRLYAKYKSTIDNSPELRQKFIHEIDFGKQCLSTFGGGN